MRRAFGKAIVRLAEKDPRVFLLAADVLQEMDEYRGRFPARFLDLGLVEQTAVGVAAGMAAEGWRPVLYSLTPFVLERPFEAVKLDVDEQNLPVILVGNGDYPTHGPSHRALDAEGLARCFKNVASFFPRNLAEAEKAMYDAYLMGGPALVCLMRDGVPFL